MSRALVLLSGLGVYALFLATFLYLVGFVTGGVVPRTVDGGGPVSPLGTALLVDVGLIALFGVQHTLMARPRCKAWLVRFVPRALERSCFVLVTCLVFAALFTQWRAIPTVMWSVGGLPGHAIFGVGLLGWVLVLVSTFLIDHFDLFGLRQVWSAFRGLPCAKRSFRERSLYRLVRHPLMLGFLLAFWAAPTMTFGRFVFATCFTLYVLVALVFEERDLVAAHGDAYVDYQRRVPRLLPFGPRR